MFLNYTKFEAVADNFEKREMKQRDVKRLEHGSENSQMIQCLKMQDKTSGKNNLKQ